MLRLVQKVITVSLVYSILAQVLKILRPMFPQPVALMSVLLLLVTGSLATYFYSRISRTEFYLILFWATVGIILGLT